MRPRLSSIPHPIVRIAAPSAGVKPADLQTVTPALPAQQRLRGAQFESDDETP